MTGSRPGGFKSVFPVDVVPDRRLELEPIPACDADVDVALQELSYLDSFEATANAACEARVRLLRDETAKKLFTPIEREDGTIEVLSFADRRAALMQALEAYARAHRQTLFDAGCKTKKLNHGVLSFRSVAESIALPKEVDPDDVLAKLSKKVPFLAAIAKLLARKLYGQPLQTIVRLEPKLNVRGIIAAWQEQRLTSRQVAALGFQLTGGKDCPETFSIDVARWTVESRSQATAA